MEGGKGRRSDAVHAATANNNGNEPAVARRVTVPRKQAAERERETPREQVVRRTNLIRSRQWDRRRGCGQDDESLRERIKATAHKSQHNLDAVLRS